jgi:hypothetical protein
MHQWCNEGLEEKKDLIDTAGSAVSPVSDVQIDFEVPYSLIIMCIGLFINEILKHIKLYSANILLLESRQNIIFLSKASVRSRRSH